MGLVKTVMFGERYIPDDKGWIVMELDRFRREEDV